MMQEFVQSVMNSVDKKLKNVHTAMPGKIVSIDDATGLATVQPMIEYSTPKGDRIDYPQITGVPILIPQGRSQGASIAFPVAPGDGCLIIVSEQSLDWWQYGHKTATDLRFDLTNAVCIPGLFSSRSDALREANANGGIVVRNGQCKLIVGQTGVTIVGDLNVTGTVSHS